MRISDWSSDVCSSDLGLFDRTFRRQAARKEGERRMNQHDLIVSVLTAAGGESIESHTRPGYTGKIADILFPADAVLVEVKETTTDRAASDETAEAVGGMFLPPDSDERPVGKDVLFRVSMGGGR